MNNQPDPTNGRRPPTDAEIEDMLLQIQCGLWSSDEELEALAGELDKDPTPLPESIRDPSRAIERVRVLLREDAGESDPATPTAIIRIADAAQDAVKQGIAKLDLVAATVVRLVFDASKATLRPQVAPLGSDTSGATNDTRIWTLSSEDALATGLACVELTRQQIKRGPRYLAKFVPATGAKLPKCVHITLIGSTNARSERTALTNSETEEIAWSLAPAWEDLRVELDVEPGA